MVQKGVYAEFPKPGIDFEDILLKTENEKAELPPGPGTPTLRKWSSSESSVQSLQSSSPSMKHAPPEDKDVSFSSCNMPWSVCSWWPCGPSVCFSRDIFVCPKVDPKFPRSYSMDLVELNCSLLGVLPWV